MRRFAFVLALLAVLVVTPQASAWSWPLPGEVLRPYSLGPDPYAAGQHRGVDVAGSAGEAVRAPAAGVVSFVGVVPSSGRTVTIQTDGYAVSLTHLGEATVAKGATVAEGDAVGIAGQSGEAEWPTPYVHLGIRVSSAADGYVDPATLLPPRAVAPPPPPAAEAPVVAPAPAPVAAPVASPAPAPATPPGAGAAPSPSVGEGATGPVAGSASTAPRDASPTVSAATSPATTAPTKPGGSSAGGARPGTADAGTGQQRPRDSGRSSVSAPVGRGGHANGSRCLVQDRGAVGRLGAPRRGRSDGHRYGRVDRRYRHPVGVRTSRSSVVWAARRGRKRVARRAWWQGGCVREASGLGSAGDRAGGRERASRRARSRRSWVRGRSPGERRLVRRFPPNGRVDCCGPRPSGRIDRGRNVAAGAPP